MDMRPNRSPRVFGEALLSLGALAGLIVILWENKSLSTTLIWQYAQALIPIVLFYAALLLIRMIFIWATYGSGGDPTDWARIEEIKKKNTKK